MRLFASIITLLVFSSLVHAHDGTYAAAASEAFAEGKPFVVFVGVKTRPVGGAVTVNVQSLEGYDKNSIVVSKPGANWLEWTATLPAEATDTELGNAVGTNSSGAVDALDEVNAVRAARGLRPYARDEGLTTGAMNAAKFRAERRITGHTANDFAYLPSGSFAPAAGCAAWEPGMGWGACCTYENWTYAGAAYFVGNDGRRYMHLFVR